MVSAIARFSIVAAVLSVLAQPACAQRTETVFFTTISNADGTYDLLVSGTSMSFGTSLVAPDGTTFDRTSPLLRDITDLTEIEFVNRFAGDWTINDAEDTFGGPAPLQTHTFSVSADSLLEFPTRPVITSPAEGAAVPLQFTATWINGESLSVIAPIGVDEDYLSQSDTMATVRLALPAGVSQMQVGLGVSDTLRGIVSTTSTEPSPRDRYFIATVKRSHSVIRSVTVLNVPEPATLTVATVAAIGLVNLGRRRN